MNYIKKIGGKAGTFFVLLFFTLISLFPLYWMFSFSLKTNQEIFTGNPIGFPRTPVWENYATALFSGNIAKYLWNSIIITSITIVLVILSALMASYGVSRLLWQGRNAVGNLFMIGLTVPIHAALLPVFLILKKLHMLNTYQSLIIPYAAFMLAMALMIFNSFMQNIPEELEEAACMDGCGTFRVFFRIIVPMMRPAMATVAIFTFLQAWNELMFATVFISDGTHRTLTVGIQNLCGTYSTNWGPIGAALCAATLPTLLIYIFMSKKVQESLIAGAIKG